MEALKAFAGVGLRGMNSFCPLFRMHEGDRLFLSRMAMTGTLKFAAILSQVSSGVTTYSIYSEDCKDVCVLAGVEVERSAWVKLGSTVLVPAGVDPACAAGEPSKF